MLHKGGREAPGNKEARGIGEDLDSGANLADGRCALKDRYMVAGEAERDGGGEPAKSRADYDNLKGGQWVCGGGESDKHTLREMGDLLCDIVFSLWYGYTANDGVIFNGTLELELEIGCGNGIFAELKILGNRQNKDWKASIKPQDRKTLNTHI